jgi:molecular chaperone DnaK
MTDSREAPILGIDLGTTKSMACVLPEGDDRPMIIHPDPRLPPDWMPSVFCMKKDGPVVGEEARQLLNDSRYRQDVVQCVKRYMHIGGKLFPRYDPQFRALDVSAFILKHLRERAEHQLGLPPRSITRAVVTVPAYFGYVERRQTRLAARDAGFDYGNVSLLDEPIAAAIGLGLDRQPGARLVMLIDLGGGTLDVTLLRVGAEAGECGFTELGRDGHNALGGLNWDEEIAKMAVLEHDLDPDALKPDNIALYSPAEEIKIFFCTSRQMDARLLSFYDRDSRKVLDTEINRADFVSRTRPLAERCGKICDRLLLGLHESDLASLREKRKRWGGLLPARRLRKVGWGDLDDVIMVGGGSQVDAVQEVIRDRWGRPPTIPDRPQHQVAFGAALCAGRQFEGSPLRSPHTIGHWYYPQGPSKPRAFKALVLRNERIDEKRDIRFRCRVDGMGPTLAVELAEERLDPSDDEEATEYFDLGTIELTDLPAGAISQPEYVQFHLRCYNEREMRITAQFRGQAKTVNLSQGVSFDSIEKE